jgi:uncharacterized membrane protein YfbV (UPF0208 family)
VATQPHPVRLVLTDDLRRSRLTVFFRLLLAIPHLFWLALFTVAAFFCALINWFATLFTGSSPRGLHDFLAGYVRYTTMVFAYLYLAANPYPPFYLGTNLNPYPVDVEIDPPQRQNRWITGFRFFLAIPALFVSGALAGGGATANSRGGSSGGVGVVAALMIWFSALARGRAPRGLRDFLAWAVAYTAQVYAYVFLLTDRYPNSDPTVFLHSLEPPDAEGRARLANTDDLRRSRLTVFFRLVLAIPHIVWLLLWTVLALLAAIVNWFFTLFAGRAWSPLARFIGAFIRYNAHVGAFFWLIANPFPGFVGAAGSYPVDPQIPPAGRQNRWITGFKIVLCIPAVFLNGALGWITFTAGLLTWFYALVLGRAPRGLQRAGAYSIGYGAQLNCYLYSLTDRYPHSSPLAVFPASSDAPALVPPPEPPLSPAPSA